MFMRYIGTFIPGYIFTSCIYKGGEKKYKILYDERVVRWRVGGKIYSVIA